MILPILSITPFTMQDFPDKTACILWFGGCNFRCAYCHNPEFIIGNKKKLPISHVLGFLNSRKHLLDGVVFSGGECTLAQDLPEFVQQVKNFGFKIKLDTNGSNPQMLKAMAKQGIIDYIALDYKAPRGKFYDLTSWSNFDDFHDSLKFLCESKIPLEVRTTVHTALLKENDVAEIIADLDKCGFKGKYFIQNFNNNETLLPLPEQERKFNPGILPKPVGFTINLRNF